MKKRDKTLLILAVSVVALAAVGVKLPSLSVYGFAKEVPVELGYNEPQHYWILSSVISEREQFKMVLHAGDTEAVDSEQHAKAESEVGLLFNPLAPISQTDMDPRTEEYRYKYWISDNGHARVPAYDINDAGWLTTARYSLSVYKDGSEVSKKQVNVNYKEPRVIQLETPNGVVTVNNLGILPQGVEVPSGDLVVIIDPWEDAHVWMKGDYLAMIEWWNEGGWVGHVERPTWFNPSPPLSYYDFWNAVVQENKLPSDVNLVHVSDVTFQGDMEYVTLYYVDIVFAGDVTVYIPSELADTVIVQLFEPMPQITNVNTDPPPTLPHDLPSIKEGESFTLSVTVKNVGTQGTISVNVQSEDYVANPITEGFADFDEGESLTFRWEVYALNTVGDSPTELRVFAQGRGGTDERLLKGMKLDVPDYTPPDPPPPPDPTPPSPGPAIPWEVLLVVAVGIILVWYVWRKKK